MVTNFKTIEEWKLSGMVFGLMIDDQIKFVEWLNEARDIWFSLNRPELCYDSMFMYMVRRLFDKVNKWPEKDELFILIDLREFLEQAINTYQAHDAKIWASTFPYMDVEFEFCTLIVNNYYKSKTKIILDYLKAQKQVNGKDKEEEDIRQAE